MPATPEDWPGSDNNGSQLTSANLSQQYANEIKILSCQPNEYSIEGEQWGGGRGAFSFNLVEALYGMADANQDLSVTLQEVGRYLEDHVPAEVAPVSQMPFVLGNRSERLAQVDTKLLADLRAGRTNQMALFSTIESRNLEDEILATVDSNIRETYFLFKKALQNRTFFEPENACAEAYYKQLIAEPKLERLHNAMRRNYAAALQDNSQRFIKALLDDARWVTHMGINGLRLKFKPTAHETERAASLLGPGHYMYPVLTGRKQFLKDTFNTWKTNYIKTKTA
ncbi:MAG: hypothetical protein IPK76_02940 [Lewinellaceae bacterium]|nr:hypothetical protein [Lewinellaceae bacterium]